MNPGDWTVAPICYWHLRNFANCSNLLVKALV